jgi:hypothetical protein
MSGTWPGPTLPARAADWVPIRVPAGGADPDGGPPGRGRGARGSAARLGCRPRGGASSVPPRRGGLPAWSYWPTAAVLKSSRTLAVNQRSAGLFSAGERSDPNPGRPPGHHHGPRQVTDSRPESGCQLNAEFIAGRVSRATDSVAAHMLSQAGDQQILDAVAGHLPDLLGPITTIAGGWPGLGRGPPGRDRRAAARAHRPAGRRAGRCAAPPRAGLVSGGRHQHAGQQRRRDSGISGHCGVRAARGSRAEPAARSGASRRCRRRPRPAAGERRAA